MSENTQSENSNSGGGKMGVIAGLIAAVVLGAGGFYAAYSGLIGGSDNNEHSEKEPSGQSSDIAFVPLEPLVVSLGKNAANRHLRFSAQLEVEARYQEEVLLLTPRVLDVLNGYLRAVDSQDIENPSSLGRLRAQMLRRVQVVTGDGRVRDFLITEFVLN